MAILGMQTGCISSTDSGTPSASQPAAARDDSVPADHVVDEVVTNLQNQSAGSRRVADYHLPPDFLRVIADQIIRSSFEDRFRIVVQDGSETQPEEHRDQDSDAVIAEKPDWLHILQNPVNAEIAVSRSDWREVLPPLVGFRAQILTTSATNWPFNEPGPAAPENIRAATDLIGKRLALDGLLFTAAQAIQILGADDCLRDEAAFAATLRACGMPVDWLAYFEFDDAKPSETSLHWIARQIQSGQSASELRSRLAGARFHFVQSLPGFRAASESGEHEIEAVRVQLTRGDYWDGHGDGGNVDMVRQLVEELPQTRVIASIQESALSNLMRTTSHWSASPDAILNIIPVQFAIAQWAQDNGKAGWLNAEAKSNSAILAPRYASRGELGSTFVPGESMVMESLQSTNFPIAQSPLLFQGGNLLIVTDPKSGSRILLLGEAEVHRNEILGLNESQILDAFRIELAVDRCEVIPAASFHIDYDFSVRSHGRELVAFVADSSSAVPIILQCAIDVMQSHNLLSETRAQQAKDLLRDGKDREFLQIFGTQFFSAAEEHGHFPLSFANQFSADPADSGVGNLQRILLALDTLASRTLTSEDLKENPSLAAYLAALKRGEAAQHVVRDRLKELGFRIVPIPTLPGESRAINYINGVHARDLWLMPAYGGLFTPLDAAAAAAYRDALGEGVKILAILSAESQRRVGAVHCSCSVLYKGPQAGSNGKNTLDH